MKYEFTGETKVVLGVTLKRIRALVAFGAIAKGELGGWIESEANLSQVHGNAMVYGDAWDKSPLQIQGTRHFCCMSTFSILSIGCIEKTIADWQRTFAAIGKEQRYSKEEIAEYKLYIDLFAARYGSGSGSGSKGKWGIRNPV